MTKKTSRHLLDILAEVPDFRNNRGKRHPLSAILALAVIAMMSGCQSYAAIAHWGRTYHKALAKALGFRHTKTPCASTLHYVFKDIDATALENALTQWAIAVLENLPTDIQTQAIAIDGKTLRGSDKQGAILTHLLSVVSHQLGITLTQQPVAAKTNEIPIATQILQALDVSGKIVTTDALLTQKKFCQTLREKNADYVLPVKANQKLTYQDIQRLFEPESPPKNDVDPQAYQARIFETLHHEAKAHTDTASTVEKAHGYITTRTLTTSTLLNEHLTWPGLAQVYEYRSERKHIRTQKITHQVQYGITSLSPHQATAKRLLQLRRGHWAIENLSHRTRDVLLGEDASQVRCGNIPQVMAALRNTVLTLLRICGYTHIAKAFRFFAAHPTEALKIIQKTETDN
jgi:predicted transposase YbfD/YdcC